ncbi:DnaA N-terminal domain-containing protein, partial [Planktotalea sp.]|uniref:DnaA N-terminal domain-containing protein n=1 Tax=Planktotalea sp. TaxID=2029877 RepID=UPI003297F9AE
MTDDDWGQLQDTLRASVGKNNYTNWIGPLTFLGTKNGVASFSVPTNFLGNYVSQNFGDMIIYQAQQAGHQVQRVHFTVLKTGASEAQKLPKNPTKPVHVAPEPAKPT